MPTTIAATNVRTAIRTRKSQILEMAVARSDWAVDVDSVIVLTLLRLCSVANAMIA